MPVLLSVNVGSAEPNPYKTTRATGINKRPYHAPVEVRAPGPKGTGGGSGLVGDFIGDMANHGGDGQAVYAFAREDLDDWQDRLHRQLPSGSFGENLTTVGLDVNGALLGERWRIGADVELAVTFGRIPCDTFRGKMAAKGWLKQFTAVGRPGAYLAVAQPGLIAAGDPIEVVFRPRHDVTISLGFRAVMTQCELLPRLLAAEEYLDDGLRSMIAARKTFSIR